MKSDYLWDGSGEPDPELQKLERTLGQFSGNAEASACPALDESFAYRQRKSWFASRMPRWAAVSALAAGAAAAIAALSMRISVPSAVAGWDVAALEGSPVIGTASAANQPEKLILRVGELLVTDGTSRAAVQVASIGKLYVEPGSRVRLLETESNRKRISVEIGTIHAAIWAPPGEFVVDTPSAMAVDLGCAYSLTVTEDGSGMLRTTLGWVGFHEDGHDSFIPAGAMCLTKPKIGPGTPYFEDATEEFRNSLHTLDFDNLGAEERRKALRTALSQARVRDAFTLWHLLVRVNETERPMVYGRLASLVGAPAGTTREGTLRLDALMLDKWWNAFDLGDIGLWRSWEQNEAPRVKKAAS